MLKSISVSVIAKREIANCKIVLSRTTRRADNKVATQVANDVITQLKELQIDMTGNEHITRKNLGKKGLHLHQHGLKKFAINLIVGIREL